jgi:hypothetical protein
MTPMDHISTGFPCPFFNMTSGAAYPNEPAMVVRTSFLESSILAIPKSASTSEEFGSWERYKRFSGLRSSRSQQVLLKPVGCSLASVNNIVVVEVVDSIENLSYSFSSIFFRKLSLVTDSVKQLAASCQLGDNVVFILPMFSSYQMSASRADPPSTQTSHGT